MPQVASEAHSANHIHARPNSPFRPAQSQDRGASSSFASLLDQPGPSDEAGPQQVPSRNQQASGTKPTDGGKAADRRVDEPGNRTDGKDADAATAKTTDTARPADAHNDADVKSADTGTADTDSKAAADAALDLATTVDTTDTTDTADQTTTTANADAAVQSAVVTTTVDPAQTTQTPAGAVQAVAAAVPTGIAGTTTAAPTNAGNGDDGTTQTPAITSPALASVAAGGKDEVPVSRKQQPAVDRTDKTDQGKPAAAAETPAPTTDAKPAPVEPGEGKDAKTAHNRSEAAPHHAAQAETPAKPDAEPQNTAAGPTDAATTTKLANGPLPSHAAAAASSDHATAAVQPAPTNTAAQSPAVPIAGLGVEIAAKAVAGKNRFEIRLDPPELGRIEVRLDVDRDGQVTSRLIADRSDTLDLLRREAPGLERALQDAGLKTSDNGLQFSLRDQTAGQQNNSGTPRETAQIIASDDTLPTIDIAQHPYRNLAGLRGGVDIRV